MSLSPASRSVRPTRSPSQRTVYVNEQTSKRQVSTPFHSPYKDGKPNPHYNNPSFISNHLFYSQQYLQTSKSSLNMTKNIVPNHNDIKRDTLYRQRIARDQSRSQIKCPKQRNRQFDNSRLNRHRILRTNQPQLLLHNELQNLHNYRETYKDKISKLDHLSRYRPTQQPVYLQPGLKQPQNSSSSASIPLHQYEVVVKELKTLRKQLRRNGDEDHFYQNNLNRLIQKNKRLLQCKQQQGHRQGQMLGNILREQIRTKEVLKERSRNY